MVSQRLLTPPDARHLRIEVKGIVQGVGFRPFVYRLARRHGVQGYVRNHTGGVTIEIEGSSPALVAFLHDLRHHPPPLAEIREVRPEEQDWQNVRGFHIRESTAHGQETCSISPDVAVCSDCLRELKDPRDRRYQYPFINCTNCGPRYTIIEDIPYDRSRTTMKAFRLCSRCRREYHDPLDRRFHAQPNACAECGPNLKLFDSDGTLISASDPLSGTAALLHAGHVVAIKGLGGYHLACDARDAAAVLLLRRRKHRRSKPFAVMVADIPQARAICDVTRNEEALLCSPRCPIVLVRKRTPSVLPEALAPGTAELGIMLPYTPLHHLLLRRVAGPLVMTSGNISDEPIVHTEEEAFDQLATIADAILTHNRAIQTRCDDSVVRIVRGREMVIRRSRGYVPQPLPLPFQCRQDVLAWGAQQKNTFCVLRGTEALLSHHLGDLDSLSAVQALDESIARFLHLFRVHPRLIACDLHPDYAATKAAKKYVAGHPGSRLVRVQHHHAHVAAVMAEHQLGQRPCVGVAFDGTGLGPDGTLWGGEFFLVHGCSFRRFAHLNTVPMPGGEQAIREPWRMALAQLHRCYGPECRSLAPEVLGPLDQPRLDAALSALNSGFNSPVTSSMGRLFDAVAALIGVRMRTTYQAQAAIELEMRAAPQELGHYPFDLRHGSSGTVVETAPLIRSVVRDRRRQVPTEVIAARFHRTVTDLIVAVCRQARREAKLTSVVLGGGVFQNRLLLEHTISELRRHDFTAYWPQRVPANDGGIALGQAVVAHLQGGS